MYGLNDSAGGSIHRGVPNYESNIAITVVIGVFMVVGATGSLFTAVLIGGKKTLHTKANLFIFSLCLSDCISALICSPLWTYRRTWGFQEWLWGEFTCKFYWVSDFTTNYATSLHIASFSALRYVAVKHPFFVKKLKKRVIVFYICVVWIVAIASATPYAYLMGVDPNRVNAKQGSCWPACSIASRNNCCIVQYQVYADVINPIMFYIPELSIAAFSLLICFELRKMKRWREKYHLRNMGMMKRNYTISVATRQNQDEEANGSSNVIQNINVCSGQAAHTSSPRVPHINSISSRFADSSTRTRCISGISQRTTPGQKETGAFLQLILIVIAYMIGYLPLTIYLLWTAATPTDEKGPNTDYWFGVFSYVFLRLSECMNPLMYNLGSSKIRNETKQTLKKIFCFKRTTERTQY